MTKLGWPRFAGSPRRFERNPHLPTTVLKQIINQDEDLESFGGSDPEPQAAATKPRLTALPGASGGKNILSSDVEIKGKLRFANHLIIDGRIEGEVDSEGDLTVGVNATIIGDVRTRSVIVFGRIEGNITVTDRCELKQSGILHGDVVAGKLAIEEGATFMGTSTVGASKPLPEKQEGEGQ